MQKTHLDKALAGLVYLSDHEHFRAVSMVALVEHGHIHIDHHALFQTVSSGIPWQIISLMLVQQLPVRHQGTMGDKPRRRLESER